MAYSGGYLTGYVGVVGQPPPFFLQPPLESSKWGAEIIGHEAKWSLWRWYEPMVQFPRTIVITAGVVPPLASEGLKTFVAGDFEAADSGSGEDGKAVFRGRLAHVVTTIEKDLLVAAGYTVV